MNKKTIIISIILLPVILYILRIVIWLPDAPGSVLASDSEIKQKIVTAKGNTPVKNIPPDYYPEGHGFWFVLQEGRDRGKKMFFRDSIYGKGVPKATIVFVHGNPESSYIYRKIIKEITAKSKKAFRLIAMDHIGFGLSDQAAYEMVCMDHAENLRQLIRHLDIKKATLIIHDWGGPIGIGAFLKEPSRISNMVITNTTVFPMPDKGYTYNNYPISWLSWAFLPTVVPSRQWGTYASYVIFRSPAGAFTILSEFMAHTLKIELGLFPEKERDAVMLFREQFQSKTNVASSVRLVRQSGIWGKGNIYQEPILGPRDTAPFYKFIQENITRLWGPGGRNIGVRAVLGRWDPLGKDEVINQWEKNLPQIKGHISVFEGVGHFIEEVKYKEIAGAILEVSGLL